MGEMCAKKEVPIIKKFWILLVAALLLVALVGTVTAAATEPETEEAVFVPNQALVDEVKQLYKTCQRSSGRKTFSGYCGLMTSYQLYKLGINPKLNMFDGKDQYNWYQDMGVTEKGYTVRAYSAKEYSLEEALNVVCANGKKTVRNILVGFQRTNTTAGAKYGHSMVINVIEGGMVYFTESFSGVLGVPEGQVVVCSVKEFADYYNRWAQFEGIVYFGEPEYANLCTSYASDVYVQVRFDSTLRSQPCLLEENGCVAMRTLDGGEVLHVTGLFESEAGDLFYRVNSGDTVGYVSTKAVYLLKPDEVPATLTKASIPTTLKANKALSISGTVASAYAVIETLTLELKDQEGNVCLTLEAEVGDDRCNLNTLNAKLKKQTLAEGSYCLTVVAKLTSTVVEQGQFVTISTQQELCRQVLTVGAAEAMVLPEEEIVRDGWFEENGTWYCYEDGKPRTGWVTRVGVRYYLKEDGSVTTGWAVIGGSKRYFTDTGALCFGWVTTYEGKFYWFDDGVMYTGMQTIGNATYYFDQDGVLVTWGTVTWEGKQYTIGADGTVTLSE